MSDIVSLFAGLNAEQGELVTARFGAVQWVIFNRPKARNAMTFAMYDRLVELCAEVNENRNIRVMVLTGAGGAFVAGTDISQFRTFETEQDALDYDARGGNVMETLEKVRVPTIAAIAGPCTGGGAGLACCCDLRVASPSARYGFPIARTLGNTLSVANYARLTALLGVSRLKDLIMTARLMDAPEMLSTGLVREVVPTEEDLLPTVQALVEQIADLAPLTLQVSKEAIRRVRNGIRSQEGDAELLLACYMSNDFKEGVEAFMGKRKPVWSGT